jgi:hypothetical protein
LTVSCGVSVLRLLDLPPPFFDWLVYIYMLVLSALFIVFFFLMWGLFCWSLIDLVGVWVGYFTKQKYMNMNIASSFIIVRS